MQYMSTRIGISAASAMDRLQASPFIPVKMEKDIRLFRPTEVYFLSKDANVDLYSTAFTFVDFGDRANIFLRACGVRAEPSVKGERCTRFKADQLRYQQTPDAGAAADA